MLNRSGDRCHLTFDLGTINELTELEMTSDARQNGGRAGNVKLRNVKHYKYA